MGNDQFSGLERRRFADEIGAVRGRRFSSEFSQIGKRDSLIDAQAAGIEVAHFPIQETPEVLREKLPVVLDELCSNP